MRSITVPAARRALARLSLLDSRNARRYAALAKPSRLMALMECIERRRLATVSLLETAEKPADCTCDYPKIVFRNGSGHGSDCPIHLRHLEKHDSFEVKIHPSDDDLYAVVMSRLIQAHSEGDEELEGELSELIDDDDAMKALAAKLGVTLTESAEWSAYEGPRGGRGWRNAAGTIHYGEHPPAAGETPDSNDDGPSVEGKPEPSAESPSPDSPRAKYEAAKAEHEALEAAWTARDAKAADVKGEADELLSIRGPIHDAIQSFDGDDAATVAAVAGTMGQVVGKIVAGYEAVGADPKLVGKFKTSAERVLASVRKKLDAHAKLQAKFDMLSKQFSDHQDTPEAKRDDKWQATFDRIENKIDALQPILNDRAEAIVDDVQHWYADVADGLLASVNEWLDKDIEDTEPAAFDMDEPDDDDDAEQLEECVEMMEGWTAKQTKRGTIKAVGTGAQDGRTLYGKRAEIALRGTREEGREVETRRDEKTRKAGTAMDVARMVGRFETLTPDHVQALRDNLPSMTRDQIRLANGYLQARLGGAKRHADLVGRLNDWLTNDLPKRQTASEQRAKAEEETLTREPVGEAPDKAKVKDPWEMTEEEIRSLASPTNLIQREFDPSRTATITDEDEANLIGVPVGTTLRSPFTWTRRNDPPIPYVIHEGKLHQVHPSNAKVGTKDTKDNSKEKEIARTTDEGPHTKTLDDYLDDEYQAIPKDIRDKAKRSASKGKDRPKEILQAEQAASDRHRSAVESALAAGKPVPSEVLSDYPDLAAKYATGTDKPNFTGRDSLGREWVDGVLVAKGDDAGTGDAKAGEMQPDTAAPSPADTPAVPGDATTTEPAASGTQGKGKTPSQQAREGRTGFRNIGNNAYENMETGERVDAWKLNDVIRDLKGQIYVEDHLGIIHPYELFRDVDGTVKGRFGNPIHDDAQSQPSQKQSPPAASADVSDDPEQMPFDALQRKMVELTKKSNRREFYRLPADQQKAHWNEVNRLQFVYDRRKKEESSKARAAKREVVNSQVDAANKHAKSAIPPHVASGLPMPPDAKVGGKYVATIQMDDGSIRAFVSSSEFDSQEWISQQSQSGSVAKRALNRAPSGATLGAVVASTTDLEKAKDGQASTMK